MDDEFLEPFNEPVTISRNSTELSRFCERLVVRFIQFRAASAKVKHTKSDFTVDALYSGLRNVCKKNDFKYLVEVHKRDGELILVRKRNGR